MLKTKDKQRIKNVLLINYGRPVLEDQISLTRWLLFTAIDDSIVKISIAGNTDN